MLERRSADPMAYHGVERRRGTRDRRAVTDRRANAFVRLAAPAGRVLTSPRIVLLICLLMNGISAVLTGGTPPEWLPYPYIWSATAGAAAVAAAIALFRVSRPVVAACGSLAVIATGTRGFWLLVACFTKTAAQRPGFTVGAAAWLGMSVFVYVLWLLVIQPWAALTVVSSERWQSKTRR